MSEQTANGKPAPAPIAPCTRCLVIAKEHGEAYVRRHDDLIRIEGLCESCHVLVRVKPLKDEEARLQDILDSVRNSLLMQLSRIGAAKEALKPFLPKPIGGRYKCRKCRTFTTDQMIQLITHEEEFCKGVPTKGAPRPRNTAATAKRMAESVDVEDVFDNE